MKKNIFIAALAVFAVVLTGLVIGVSVQKVPPPPDQRGAPYQEI